MGEGSAPALDRFERDGVTMVGVPEGRVRFGFTERTGGVSVGALASLNLGGLVGDDPAAVAENRRRAVAALGAGDALDKLIVPHQVHGDEVVVVASAEAAAVARARAEAEAGADAVVCCASGVPVMLCFADCVPVVLVCASGFAIAHSGWRGTFAGIAGKTAWILAQASGCPVSEMRAYIGPHILGDEYEVSPELMERFAGRFESISGSGRLLDLSAAIIESLEGAGVPPRAICDPGLSTVRLPDRFFSYRASGGTCGRHAAVGVMEP